MASALKNLSDYHEMDIPNGENFKFSIIVSEWNTEITHALYQNCLDTLLKHGVKEDHIEVFQVPGAFEIPTVAKWAFQSKQPDAIIGLGCVIRGETKHDDYINHATAQAMQSLSIHTNTPCIFGVVTTNTLQQAIDRSGGAHGNKGVESAVTALRMIGLKQSIEGKNKSIGF